jgi:hypothetical protein
MANEPKARAQVIAVIGKLYTAWNETEDEEVKRKLEDAVDRIIELMNEVRKDESS